MVDREAALAVKARRLAWSCAAVAGGALLAIAAADWLFYQSFLFSLAWR